MYFQKDYVLRMIEMLGEMMRRIGALAEEADARAELNEISGRACGMPMAMLKTADPDALAELLGEAQRFLAAELLAIDLQVSRRKHTEDELLPTVQQALSLYASLFEPDYLLPACDRASRMMEGALDVLPADTLLSVALLEERGGQYAAAEDALFAAYAKAPRLRPEAEAFYGRLFRLSDAELKAGGFSREEIGEGLSALK